MSREVIFVQPGFGDRGGVTADVVNLLEGSRAHGVDGVAVGSLAELRAALKTSRRAVVHVFGCVPSPTIFGAIALARAKRIPLVWTPIFNPIRPTTWAGYGLLRAMELFDRIAPHAARLTDAVIAATAAEADYFRSIGGRRVEVIPPGVEPPERPATRAQLTGFRERLGLGAGPVVLTVARDNSRKALPFGHDVFAALGERIPESRFLLVGPERTYVRAGDPGVVCPGWLDQSEIALAYQAGDVLFVPSLYEGLPRAVIEAWRWATPVVATDRVALAPLIDGRGGLVAPYGDVAAASEALASLLGNRRRAQQLGANGLDLVRERFLLSTVVPSTAQLYSELLDA